MLAIGFTAVCTLMNLLPYYVNSPVLWIFCFTWEICRLTNLVNQICLKLVIVNHFGFSMHSFYCVSGKVKMTYDVTKAPPWTMVSMSIFVLNIQISKIGGYAFYYRILQKYLMPRSTKSQSTRQAMLWSLMRALLMFFSPSDHSLLQM